MTNTAPHASTTSTFEFDRNKPLILSDADEVLVHFIQPLEGYLLENGYSLDLSSYRLFGNIRHITTGEVADKDTCLHFLDSFFKTHAEACPAVEGAADALAHLSQDMTIIVLSNVPQFARAARERSLASLGMPYPVFANEGPKGPAVRDMILNHKAPVYFIDDIPSHHESVAAHAAHVRRIHFIADQRIAKLLDKAEHAHTRLSHWSHIETFIRTDMIKA